MIAIRIRCEACRGAGFVLVKTAIATVWPVCKACDGLGAVFASGAPSYGCVMTLGERLPGERLELGTGDVVILAWKMPRAKPTTVFVHEVDAFDDVAHEAIPLPAETGVREILESRAVGRGGDARGDDAVDPLRRRTELLA